MITILMIKIIKKELKFKYKSLAMINQLLNKEKPCHQIEKCKMKTYRKSALIFESLKIYLIMHQ